MNIWTQRVVREWIDNKWGGLPAAIWDLTTMISVAIASAVLGFFWTLDGGFTGPSDLLTVALWAAAGLAGGWVYVVLRRPS